MSVSYPPQVEPNPEAQAIDNLVPGAEMLGYGFNIFGAYSFDSGLKPLFELGAAASWTAPGGKTYNVPANVTTPGGSSSSATATTFATSSAFSSYFQSSASVSGSIGAFSASFSSTYDTSQQNSQNYSWALVEADFNAWHVGIKYSPEILLGTITGDTDWKDLPTQFNPKDSQNVLAFYRFFQKFGTHFISSVTAGGTLYYYFCVAQSARYTSTQISVSASAEYQGLICSTSAEASAHWGQCASNWTSNRQSHAVTVPATTGVINWVNPASGSYDQSGSFAEWKAAVVDNPSRCKFALTPIWALFSGAQWLAIQQAYAAYASNRISLQATMGGTATILVNGTPIIPTGGYPAPGTQGWQFVVLDRKTLEVKLNKFYTFNYGPRWPDAVNNAIVEDLTPYSGAGDYMLIAATSNLDEGCNPNTALFAILKSFGAGAGLQTWNTRPYGCSDGPGSAVYGLIGAGASAAGLEGFGDQAISGSPTSVMLNALLLPSAGRFMPIPYQP